MTVISTSFNPEVHGFKFINHFEFPDLFKVTPVSIHKGMGDILYGLCGGMCFAALDYYREKKQVIAQNNVEEIPLWLFHYLWERQLNTLTEPVLEKLISWSIYDSAILSKLMAKNEIPAILKSIDSGAPCVLLFMRSQGFLQITQNHQVVATAYELDPATKDLAIQLYDPNHPGGVPNLTMNLSKPNQVINLSQSTGEALRGFFMIDYHHVSPVK